MRVSPNTTIRQIAMLVPGSSDVLQQEGIDLVRESERTLEEACIDADVSLDYLARRLESVSRPAATDWQIEPLFALTSHIVNQHHEYARREMPRLVQQSLNMTSEFGGDHPELARIEVLLRAMVREFSLHMTREEQMIFPYIVQLESADQESGPAPVLPIGAENPLHHIMAEHDSAVEMLRELRYLTTNFTPPPEAPVALERFYKTLQVFEADMQKHIRLEDNILFPRALDLEIYTIPVTLRGRGE